MNISRKIKSIPADINKDSKNGYYIVEYDYPQDRILFETEDYAQALSTLEFLQINNPEGKFYIREITDEEVDRAVNIRAHMM